MAKKFVSIEIKNRKYKLDPQDIKKVYKKMAKILPPLPNFQRSNE
jgi:hypothetical protein